MRVHVFLFLGLLCLAAGALVFGKADGEFTGWQRQDVFAKIIAPRLERGIAVVAEESFREDYKGGVWRAGTDYPGKPGVSMITAYHDTHGFVRHLQAGDELVLNMRGGKIARYTVDELLAQQESELKISTSKNENVLLLTSCYEPENWQNEKEICFIAVSRPLPLIDAVTS